MRCPTGKDNKMYQSIGGGSIQEQPNGRESGVELSTQGWQLS